MLKQFLLNNSKIWRDHHMKAKPTHSVHRAHVFQMIPTPACITEARRGSTQVQCLTRDAFHIYEVPSYPSRTSNLSKQNIT